MAVIAKITNKIRTKTDENPMPLISGPTNVNRLSAIVKINFLIHWYRVNIQNRLHRNFSYTIEERKKPTKICKLNPFTCLRPKINGN